MVSEVYLLVLQMLCLTSLIEVMLKKKELQEDEEADIEQNYLVKLVTTKDLSPTSPFWTYLQNVGVMHTGRPGFKHRKNRPDLRVEYIHMGALLGYVMDTVIGAVIDMKGVEIEMKSRVMRALNKVVWIQNDLFVDAYLTEDKEKKEGGVLTPPLGHPEVEKGGKCPFG